VPMAPVGEPTSVARQRLAEASDPSGEASPAGWLLLVDAARRPLGWVAAGRVPAEGVLDGRLAEPTDAVLTPWMSLRDALSVMLDAEVVTGIVVDADGHVRGVLTIDQLAGALR